MTKNLVIVESPAKAKTIEKFLGKDYKVESSFGHIADLPAKELGVDVYKDFKPKYIVSEDKKTIVKKLKGLATNAETVWLASDEDREGEAISWHLAETLELNKSKIKRIVFNSITKKAIKQAIENPRAINYDLVDAQQARRVLDRLVGYQLSPVLWKKIKPGLSAGRVQSVAVRLIVEREREIKKFVPKASFKVVAEFVTEKGKVFTARLEKTFENQKEAESFLERNKNTLFTISNLNKKSGKKTPAAPFTTSTLQQEASRKLYFSVGKTMNMAQRLYEAGLITYMRTDSVNLSEEAMEATKEVICNNYGEKYSQARSYTSKTKGAQEAHEAIRPTDMKRASVSVETDQAKLYELIWKRTVASQMSDAQLEKTIVKIRNNTDQNIFVANGEVLKFDGFLKVYLEGTDEEEVEKQGMLPAMEIGEPLVNHWITATERFSRYPYRFTEASLVKKLEELGIGRPSTYAPTISTIQNRNYVKKGTIEGYERNYTQLLLKDKQVTSKTLSENIGSDKGKLVPTDIGMVVNDFLVQNFSTILDYNFTAKVEQSFDNIAEGSENWTTMIKGFYKDFYPTVKEVEENAKRAKGERVLGTDPKSGRQVSVRLGKFGAMVQIGTLEEEEKPRYASLLPEQSIDSISFEDALELFDLPRELGAYEGEVVEVNRGRFGPYVRFGKKYISLDKKDNIFEITFERAVELIQMKQKADAPIAKYDGIEVTKGVGRFGPFLKWNNMFINVSKKYDFDNLSSSDINTLIQEKIQKEKDKIIREWPEENIRIEKARWGRHVIFKEKQKIEVDKSIDVRNFTLEDTQKFLEKNMPKKRASKKTTNTRAKK